MENIAVSSLKRQLKSAQTALEGFPWRLATVLYTLSWGWSLLRPNTLYWDDWAFIYGQPKTYLNKIFGDTGLPPWRALIDQELIAIGYWTIQVLTFLMFFAAGIFVFAIFQKIKIFTVEQTQFITIVFLIIPINHSRIALVLFGYTTSYFLFFLAWLILVRSRTLQTFFCALAIFFWSFMTHSLLFFYLLPIIHFFILQRAYFNRSIRDKTLIAKTISLVSLPFVYYLMRSWLWYPKPEWNGYHSFRVDGATKGLVLLIFGTLIVGSFEYLFKRIRPVAISPKILTAGWVVFAWGLFPYFASGRLIDYISVTAFRSDWGGRNIMLAPIGAALLLSGLADLISINLRKLFRSIIISVFVVINIFFGTQIYLDSLKKNELTTLFVNANRSGLITPESRIIFLDETKIFNTRFSTYRDPELRAKLTIAEVSATSITGKVTCSKTQGELEVKLVTNKSYLDGLFSRNLGLQLEVNEC